MAAVGWRLGGRALSYLKVRRGRPTAFHGSGHSTTKRYAEPTCVVVYTAVY